MTKDRNTRRLQKRMQMKSDRTLSRQQNREAKRKMKAQRKITKYKQKILDFRTLHKNVPVIFLLPSIITYLPPLLYDWSSSEDEDILL
jgi:hypothetical protein